MKLLFTKAEQFLLKNQRQFVLSKRDENKANSQSQASSEVLDLGSRYFYELLDGTRLGLKPQTQINSRSKRLKISQNDLQNQALKDSELQIQTKLMKLDDTGVDDD